MTDKPQTLAEAIGVCLTISQRCLAEVRAIALDTRAAGRTRTGRQSQAKANVASLANRDRKEGPVRTRRK